MIDKNIQKKIVRVCDLTKADIVLEIGAGKGDLTALLAQKAKQVFALEIDQRFYPLLQQQLSAYSNCQIVQADILKFNLSKFLEDNHIKEKIKVIGNIPYYISSPIIEQLIKYRQEISAVFISVQKEFGQRARAIPGSKEYGSFSCFLKYYCECKICFEIKKNCFKPAPKVESCFLSLRFREQPAVIVQDKAMLFKLIRTAFNQRRKTLRNSLEELVSEEALKVFLEKFNIDNNIRPENLALEQFANLSNYLCR